MLNERATGKNIKARQALAQAQAESEDGWVDVLTWEAAFTEHLEDGYEGAVKQAYANMGISYE